MTTGAASTGGGVGALELQARPASSRLAAAAGHRAIDLTLALPLFGILALVPALFAVDQRQLGFDAPLLLVQRQRDDGAPLLANLSGQPIDLTAVQQQLPLAPRLVVPHVRL